MAKTQVVRDGWRCMRCEYAWIPKSSTKTPTVCPSCRSPRWYTPRRTARTPEALARYSQLDTMGAHARERGAYVEEVIPQVVFERDKGICGICQQPVDPLSIWHVDHVTPLAREGEHSYANVQLAHGTCNIKKGARLPAGWDQHSVRALMNASKEPA